MCRRRGMRAFHHKILERGPFNSSLTSLTGVHSRSARVENVRRNAMLHFEGVTSLALTSNQLLG
jgi:hypothetical protein